MTDKMVTNENILRQDIALESTAHPGDPRTIERLARRATEAEGINPDQIGEGLGVVMPLGVRYPLWKARVKVVQAVLDELAIIDAEMAVEWQAAVERSTVTEEIEIKSRPGVFMPIEVRDGETIRDAITRMETGTGITIPPRGFRAWLRRLYG